MTARTCPLCSRILSPERFACRTCEDDARKNLRSIATFAGWADSKRARMGSSWSIGGGSRATETPVPFDPRVTRVVAPIHNDLTGWARIVWDGAPGASEDVPGLDTRSVALWLVGYVAWIATTEQAGDAFAAWESARANLEVLFDNPPERVYVGKCGHRTPGPDGETLGPECPEALYVEVENKPEAAACGRCGHLTNIAERSEELAEKVGDYLGTARELSRLLRLVLGEDANPRMLWAYAKNGLIGAHGHRLEYDTLGRARQVPLYKIREVRAAAETVASDVERRRAVKRTMRGDCAVNPTEGTLSA